MATPSTPSRPRRQRRQPTAQQRRQRREAITVGACMGAVGAALLALVVTCILQPYALTPDAAFLLWSLAVVAVLAMVAGAVTGLYGSRVAK